MSDFRNPDGTYNGVKMMAALSGLSEAEIKWTFDEMKRLMNSGMAKEEAKALVKERAKSKPWEGGR